jgi:hypothetical protein
MALPVAGIQYRNGFAAGGVAPFIADQEADVWEIVAMPGISSHINRGAAAHRSHEQTATLPEICPLCIAPAIFVCNARDDD